jgi:hypothetical protein
MLFAQYPDLLYTTQSARVVEGTWNRTRVAVKILKTDEGVTPNIDVRLDALIR